MGGKLIGLRSRREKRYMRSAFLLVLASVMSLCVSRPSFAAPELGSARVLRLYGATAKLSGQVKFDSGPRWLAAVGGAGISWPIEVRRSGEYRISIVYAADDPGHPYRLSIGAHRFDGTLRSQSGIFADPLQNFTRMQVAETSIAGGRQVVQIRLQSSNAKVYLRSVEIEPVTAERRAERAAAERSRADTDWLADGPYGVMFHWTDQSQPRHGPAKSYAQAVADFNVPKFAKMVAGTGAAYVIFTVNHADPTCPAPIMSWQHYHPGWTTRRDLIGEIADALGKRHIRLILYIASHTLGGLYKSSAAKYIQIHEDVFSELGKRYGTRIAGYWLDGWYQTMEAYPGISTRKLQPYIRAGNPNRLVAYNFWIYPVETPWQDYWAGEVAGPVTPAGSRFIRSGPGAGLQDHNLIILDAPWVHSTPNSEMEPPRFSTSELIEYVRAMHAHHEAVTLNVGIFQDGTIGEKTKAQLAALREALRAPSGRPQ